jgi:hypothetical protein
LSAELRRGERELGGISNVLQPRRLTSSAQTMATGTALLSSHEAETFFGG